ncbi:MAG TPA: PBP1A family penicillin-binding protein [Aliiroseovarius sp.]|nr:PBP1A family penicillin-binding protein [Aliiroseovarius sp.]
MSGPGKKRPPLVADKRYDAPSAKPRRPRKKAAGAKARPAAKGKSKAKTKARTGQRSRARLRRPAKAPARRLPRVIGWPLWLARWLMRLIWGLTLRGAMALGLVLAVAVFYFYTTIPPLDDLVDGRARGSVTMLDRDGNVYAWRGEQFGGIITVDNVSPHLKNAVVATEDRRFYRHFGVSPRGIASAMRINIREGRSPLSGNGGSTLTQQVAKLLCLGVPYDPDKWANEAAYEKDCRRSTLWRKAKEAVYAMALEARFTKDEILSIYLNRAFLGAGAYGFEAASQRYFGKSAAELRPAEAAMLAGALTAPTRYAPTNDLARSQARAATVIKLMAEQGYLTPAQAQYAWDNPATLSAAATARAGGYFADWIMSSGPDFLTRDTTEDVIIRTTLDPAIQQAAEDAITSVFADFVSEGSEAQAAIVIMSADGAVRAMVGGRKVRASGAFNRAVQAQRQTGSAFKPFVYAAALDLGWQYNSPIVDEPFCLNIPGSGEWCPRNYTGKNYGRVSLTQALMKSLNIPAVKLSEAVGRENVRTVAEGFGLQSDLALGPALALGASESTLIDMTGAYAGILNGGSAVVPYGLLELRLIGDDVPLMTQAGGIGERVISPQAAEQLIFMMNRVIEEGTGKRARLEGVEVAGKTGTTQAARDAWFVGFTADYVAGVWMGYDDNRPLKGVTGGGLPAEIWRQAMERIYADLPARPLPMIRPTSYAPPPEDPLVPEGAFPGQPAQPGQPGQPAGNDPILSILQAILGGN